MSLTLTTFIHGDSKAGKSWTADTAPGPRLLLDSEGKAQHLPSNKVWWDPSAPVPMLDQNDTAVVDFSKWSTVRTVYEALTGGGALATFNSINFDSVMESQDRLIDQIGGTDQLNQQDWGEVLREASYWIRQFKDLRYHPTNMPNGIWALTFTAGSSLRDGIWQPLLRGQLQDRILYWVDLVGYLAWEIDPAAPTEPASKMLTIQPGGFPAARSGTNIASLAALGPKIKNPNITELLTVLNQQGG